MTWSTRAVPQQLQPINIQNAASSRDKTVYVFNYITQSTVNKTPNSCPRDSRALEKYTPVKEKDMLCMSSKPVCDTGPYTVTRV